MGGLESFPVSLVNLDEDAPRPPRERPKGLEKADRETAADLSLPTPAKSETPQCEGCAELKPIEEYGRYLKIMGEADASDEPPAMLCDYCAVYGPPMADPFHKLTPRELKAIESLAAGGSINAAAKIMKIKHGQLKQMIQGDSDKTIFRAAYKRMMLQVGATPSKTAQVFADGLEAEKAQWNSEKGGFDFFPDHSNRMKAAAAVQKVLELEQPQEKAGDAPAQANTFNFVTNLDGKSQAPEVGYTIIDTEGKKVGS